MHIHVCFTQIYYLATHIFLPVLGKNYITLIVCLITLYLLQIINNMERLDKLAS